MPNIAAVTFGFSTRLSSTAAGKAAGRKRSTGEPGARFDVEAVLGLFQRLLEHPHVAFLHLDDRGVAKIVHINGGGAQQHALLEHAQSFARAGDLAFGRTRLVGGLLAVEQRLRHGHANAARRIGAVDVASHDRGRAAALTARRAQGVGVLIAGTRRHRHFGTIA
jgi:hypothetical protein